MNIELQKLYDWLTANKATLNAKKYNHIIFRSYQQQQNNPPRISIYDNETNKSGNLEGKDCMKYLGVLIDENLS